MTRPTEDRPRRRVLKSLAVTGAVHGLAAVPGEWSRPVVESVLLPAHAQTSASPEATESSDAGEPEPSTPPEDIFTISCSASCFVNDPAGTPRTFACVSGQLLASDGTDMSGVGLSVTWFFSGNSPVTTLHSAQNDGFFGNSPNVICSEFVDGFFATLLVRVEFTDQGVFGTNFCESSPICTT